MRAPGANVAILEALPQLLRGRPKTRDRDAVRPPQEENERIGIPSRQDRRLRQTHRAANGCACESLYS